MHSSSRPSGGRPVDAGEVALEEEAIALLRFADLDLHPLAARDVPQDRLHAGLPSNSIGVDAELDGERRPVAAQAHGLVELRGGGSGVAVTDELFDLLARSRREEDRDRNARRADFWYPNISMHAGLAYATRPSTATATASWVCSRSTR